MIYEYSGCLFFDSLSDWKWQAIQKLASESGLDINLGTHYIEFEYAGRDTNRKIVRFLLQLAKVIYDAEGDVTCTIDREDSAPDFEFYSIKHGKLYRQKGRIVKGPTEEIKPEV